MPVLPRRHELQSVAPGDRRRRTGLRSGSRCRPSSWKETEDAEVIQCPDLLDGRAVAYEDLSAGHLPISDDVADALHCMAVLARAIEQETSSPMRGMQGMSITGVSAGYPTLDDTPRRDSGKLRLKAKDAEHSRAIVAQRCQ